MTSPENRAQHEQQRLQQLEARTYHIDGELAAVKTQVSGMVDSLERIESSLLNRPDKWNNGSIVAMLSLIATIIFGGGVYLDNQLSHLRDDIERNEEHMEILDSFRHQMHYEVGVLSTLNEEQNNKLDHFDTLDHKRDDRLRELEKKLEYGLGFKDGITTPYDATKGTP